MNAVNSRIGLRFYSTVWYKLESHPLIFFVLLHISAFLLFFTIDDSLRLGEMERSFAIKMINGRLPYANFPVEYPPLALLTFLLPAIFFRTPQAYGWAFGGEFLIINLIILVLIAAIAPYLQVSKWKALGIYTAFLIGIGALVFNRYDLLPTMLVLLALFAFLKKKTTSAWTASALGTMSKIYPAMLVPIFALYHLSQRSYRKMVLGIAVFLFVLLAISLPWLLLNADGFLHFLTYHAVRGLHSESTYGVGLLVGGLLGITQVKGVFNFGSWNLSSPLADLFANISVYITAGLLLIVYLSFAYQLRKRSNSNRITNFSETETAALIVRYTALAILVTLLASKVFSPQYLIWLCPIIALLKTPNRYTIWALFLVAAGFTQYVYPYHYGEFELGDPLTIYLLAARNLLLIIVAVLLAIPARQPIQSNVNVIPD